MLAPVRRPRRAWPMTSRAERASWPLGPGAAGPPHEVPGAQVVPPEADHGELWLQVVPPTQVSSVDMDPLWVESAGEWDMVTSSQDGWALAAGEDDTTGWSVRIQMDQRA